MSRSQLPDMGEEMSRVDTWGEPGKRPTRKLQLMNLEAGALSAQKYI